MEEQNTIGETNKKSSEGSQKNVGMGILAYIGPLVLIPHFTVKNDPFVKFHAKQGFVLLGIEIVVWILSMFLWQLWMLWNLVSLCTIILSIVGIVHVVNGKEEKLPIIGDLSKFVTF